MGILEHGMRLRSSSNSLNSSSYLRGVAGEIVVVLVVSFKVIHTFLDVISQLAERASVPRTQ